MQNKVFRTWQDMRTELRALEARDALECIERRRQMLVQREQEATVEQLRRFGMIVR